MKLLARYNRLNLATTIGIFIISGLVYYFVLSYILTHQVDDDLRIEETEIKTYISRYHHLPVSISVNDQLITSQEVPAPFLERHITTIKMRDAEKEEEAFRQIVFGVAAGGKNYIIKVSKSLEDTDALIHSILVITGFTITCILLASFVINRVIVKKLWKPFYSTLDKVRKFKLGKNTHFHLPAESVEEFDFMNQAIQGLIQQAERDYYSLKTFSENASHETQTPLAVIRSKLDLLIQDASLTGTQSSLLQSIYLAIEKLTRLNRSLLLLTKIDNNQYEEKEHIDIKSAIDEKLADFQELWQSQNITVNAGLAPVHVSINPELLEILLNNLFSNATRHNFPGGIINIDLNYEQLKITNTSKLPRLLPGKMYQRFYKGESVQESNSLGLGLSIIQQICRSSGFAIDYFFRGNEHMFIIRWG
jgi:signal transduction histidine kinase